MIFMNREQYAPFDTEDCDNDGIVNYALDVKGCEIAVFAHGTRKGADKGEPAFRREGGCFGASRRSRRRRSYTGGRVLY